MQRTTSPIGGNRACLCEDNTYRKECCKGLILNQGIGSLVGQNTNEYSVVAGQNKSNSVTQTNTQQVLLNNSNATNFTCSDVSATFTVSDTGATSLSLASAELVVDGMPLVDALKHTCLPFYPVQGGDDTERVRIIQVIQSMGE